MIEKILSILWDTVNPQKNLDKQQDRLTKANISKKVREQLITESTRATITYGIWTWIIYTLILIFAGIYVLLSLWMHL